jgi:hypothetical protein
MVESYVLCWYSDKGFSFNLIEPRAVVDVRKDL